MADTPEEYIEAVDELRRPDIAELDGLIRQTLPSFERHMTHGMLGYGRYHYRYASGREAEGAVIALAANKRYISLHVACTTDDGPLVELYKDRLPMADIGKSCVRFKRLEDLEPDVLRDLLVEAGMSAPAVETEK
jgi:hypothetical protein